MPCVGQKVERYCVVYWGPRAGGFSKWVAKLETWKEAKYFSFRDSSVLNELYGVNGLTTTMDVLNYMASIGWTIVNSPSTYGNGAFFFRREFDPSELVAPAH